MGVSMCHYVMFGYVFTEGDIVTKICETDAEKYHDNPYKDKVTGGVSGIHEVSDGMNGEYSIIGFILSKGTESDGLQFTQPSLLHKVDKILKDKSKVRLVKQVCEDVYKLNPAGTGKKLELMAFTYWH